jgi:hypothetical protein
VCRGPRRRTRRQDGRRCRRAARRACVHHVHLDHAFADADAELQELAANPLRAPERAVFGHRSDERDFRGKSHRLIPGSGSTLPDELEEIPVPSQRGLGIDQVQGVSPSAAQPVQDEQEQAVIAVDPRSADTATEHDHLLTE